MDGCYKGKIPAELRLPNYQRYELTRQASTTYDYSFIHHKK
jgi:hypothetical protein